MLTGITAIVIGAAFVVLPETMMRWHRRGWSWLVGEQRAEWAAVTVFMPPRFIYPRVLGLACIALGFWLVVDRR